MNRYVGNLPPMPGVFPDYPAPVVRYARAERELMTMCWEMPPPPRTGGYSGHTLWLPDDRTERRCRSDTSESDAGNPDH